VLATPAHAADTLASYVGTYLHEEIVVEAERKVLNRPSRLIAIEAKATDSWRPEWSATLDMLAGHPRFSAAYGVYLGDRTIVNGQVTVLPLAEFSRRLWAGEIF
jgi:hypothetical protein